MVRYLISGPRVGARAIFVTTDSTQPMSTTIVKGFMSMAVQGVMDDLGPAFERASGTRVAVTFNTSKMLVQALQGGAEADIVVGTREGMESLAAAGLIVPGSGLPLAQSVIGIAVRKGAAKPDISTPEAFKRSILAARSIGYSEPAGGGASGVHFEKVLHHLGIADAVRPKSKHPPVGTHAADMLLTGEVDLAIQQVAELIYVPGIDLVGPFPDALQQVTVFVGAVHAKAQQPQAAKALLAFLRTPAGSEAFRAQRLEPVVSNSTSWPATR
jgi:molybdate transport system substrate-binding protein